MRRRTLISSLFLAAIAAISLSSCDKMPKIPTEVAGLGDALSGATESLTGIAGANADEAVAKAKEALPDLQGVGAQLSSVQGLMDKLPGPAKQMVTSAIEKFGPQIEGLIGKVSSIPGVSGAIQPALDKITAGLTALKG